MRRIRSLSLLLAVLAIPVTAARADDAPWFTDVAATSGLAGVEGKRVKWIDLDGDGWTDLLVMAQDGANRKAALLKKLGHPKGFVGTAPNLMLRMRDLNGDEQAFFRLDLNRDAIVHESEIDQFVRTQLWSAFRSIEGKRFENITAKSGQLRGRPVHMLVAGDIDDDGDLDLFASGYATQHPSNKVETPPFWLINDGKGKFMREDTRSGKGHAIHDNVSTVCGACFLDYDGDGKLDLFVGSWYRDFGNGLAAYADRLYRNDGEGELLDVSHKVGLKLPYDAPGGVLGKNAKRPFTDAQKQAIGRTSNRPTYGVAAADWDNDGDLDLFTMSYGRQWNTHWRNDGGRFVEIGKDTGFDGDAVRHGKYPEDVRRRAELPFRSNGNTFDVSFGDWNNDGLLDCILSEYTHRWAGESSDVTEILTNRGKEHGFAFRRETGAIERIHSTKNWNQGDFCVAWIDADNDGRLDLLVSSSVYPDRNVLELHHQTADGKFVRVTDKIGLNWPDSTQLSLADYDMDGDLDILAGNNPHPSRAGKIARQIAVFRNDIANRSGNRFVSLKLRGRGWRNRAARTGSRWARASR